MLSDEALRWQTCERKQRYGKEMADRVARYWTARGEKKLRAYRCVACRAWHVGHRPPWQVIRSIRDRLRPPEPREEQ